MRSELIVGLDFCRVVACLMVVVLHLSTPSVNPVDPDWITFNIYNSFVRPCVPLFLMLSGALLLGKKEACAFFYTKRYLRVLPPLLFWTIVYSLWKARSGSGSSDITTMIITAIQGPVYYHLWYLYVIVGLYLFVPFMAKIYQNTTRQEQKIFIAMWLAAGCVLPTAAVFAPKLSGLENTYGLLSFTGLGGYLFLGAYVFDRLKEHTGLGIRTALFTFIASSALNAWTTYLLSIQAESFNPTLQGYTSPLVAVAAVSVFWLCLSAGEKLMRLKKTLALLSGCTLGIYCLHAMIMNRTSLIWGPLVEGHSMVWVVPVLSCMIFTITFAIIYLFRLIRPLRTII